MQLRFLSNFAMAEFLSYFVLPALIAVYFLPSLIASKRDHHQGGAIVMINLFLGWTLIGWVLALAMSMSAVKPDPKAAEWKPTSADDTDQQRLPCPVCAELILPAARKCQFCQSELPDGWSGKAMGVTAASTNVEVCEKNKYERKFKFRQNIPFIMFALIILFFMAIPIIVRVIHWFTSP